MSEHKFQEPRLLLSRIYTRRGDTGETSLVGGQRAPKNSLRIECYGTIDELNSFTGAAGVTLEQSAGAVPELRRLQPILRRVQHELFNLGSIMATLPQDVGPKQPRVTANESEWLERDIDSMNEPLPALNSFVLPGGTRLNADLHICRTVCRRAERLVVALAQTEEVPTEAIRYLNRLSDAFFVWSRWANHASGVGEVLWSPNEAASARSEREVKPGTETPCSE